MSCETNHDAETVVLKATSRTSLAEAIAWLAEDHPMAAETEWTSLLRSLVKVADESEIGNEAVRRVVKEVTLSSVDTSRVLFDSNDIPDPKEFRDAYEELLHRSSDGTFGGLTGRSILRAQRANSRSIQTLCLIAGVALNDVEEWFGPSSGEWKEAHVAALLSYLTKLVNGEIDTGMPNTVPARGIEFISSDLTGWGVADELRENGVPFELFLAQRAVGGAWSAHKNKTSRFPNMVASDTLCEKLSERQVEFRRATELGGTSKQKDLQKLSGIRNKRIGIVAVSNDQPIYAVAFSAARDGGTARANGDGLLQIETSDLPLALVLTGVGWAGRQETDRLARRFRGRLFTERNLDQLVKIIEEASS